MSARERRAAERDRSRSSISRTRDDGLDDSGGGGGGDDDGGSSRDRDDDDPSTGASSGLGGSIPGAPSDSGGGGGGRDRDDDDDDRSRSRDRDDDDDRAAGGFGRELGGDPAGADQAEQDVMDETARADQEASRRVGGSGDPTESDTRVDPFVEDTQASQRVGGSGDPFDEPVDPVDTDASRADQQASQQLGGSGDPFEQDTSFGGELVQAQQQARETDERFAFEEDTIQRRIVTGLTEAGEAVSERITPQRLQESPTTARQVGVGPLTAVGFGVSPALEQPDTQEPGELASFGSGAAEVLNVPATAGGLAQGVEFGVRAGQRTAAGEGGEVAQDIEASGRDIAAGLERAATERPVQTGGMLAGSLVGSAGAIRAAQGVSGRAGAATRAAIQPGEEIAGIGGARATRAVAGERAAETLFPQNEPLIFSEEAAIRAGRAAGGRVRQTLTPPEDGSVGRVGAGFGASGRSETDIETEEEAITSATETAAGGVEVDVERLSQLDIEDISAAERELLEEALGEDVDFEAIVGSDEGVSVGQQRAPGTAQRGAASVQPSRAEFETEAETEAELEAETRLRPEVDLDQLVDQQTAVDQELAVDQTQVEAEALEVATELDQRLTQDLDQRLDQETDQRQELELEQLEAEVEAETRVATELESLFETEQEIEGEPRLPGELEDQQIAADFDSLTGVRAVEATLAPTEFDDA